ncbi:hypothetical protein DL98DRAFT_537946 [Cadophora sp. DSE1049]|nr:hypothetical protein DL98DRAFT_537946 [Cadophora sp. DSE1049]
MSSYFNSYEAVPDEGGRERFMIKSLQASDVGVAEFKYEAMKKAFRKKYLLVGWDDKRVRRVHAILNKLVMGIYLGRQYRGGYWQLKVFEGKNPNSEKTPIAITVSPMNKIMVSTKTIEFFPSDSELARAIAREIVRTFLSHEYELQRGFILFSWQPIVLLLFDWRLGLGTFFINLISTEVYCRLRKAKHHEEADRLGMRRAVTAGYPEQGATMGLEKIAAELGTRKKHSAVMKRELKLMPERLAALKKLQMEWGSNQKMSRVSNDPV